MPHEMLDLLRVPMPGRAGKLQQAAGSAEELARELATYYREYHRFLADQLAAQGPPPHPRDYPDDFAGFMAACERRDSIATAELVLRGCVRANADRGYADLIADDAPLVDDHYRLRSIDPKADRERPARDGFPSSHERRLPPPPIGPHPRDVETPR